MSNETQNRVVESMLQAILAGEPSYFLVEIKVKPTNNIKIFLDGDDGITIEKCVKFNRALYKQIEETALYPDGDFSLEVSSPGLEEPLKIYRQYKKNIGRNVEVVLQDGTKTEGILREIGEDSIIVEESKGKGFQGRQQAKKKELVNHTFLFSNIKTTKIQVVF